MVLETGTYLIKDLHGDAQIAYIRVSSTSHIVHIYFNKPFPYNNSLDSNFFENKYHLYNDTSYIQYHTATTNEYKEHSTHIRYAYYTIIKKLS